MKTWVSLRQFLDEIESETEYGNLDRTHQRLLEWIAIRGQRDAPLHIQEIVMKSRVASPATIHKVLSNLELLDFISLSVDAEDSRRRIVKITPRTDRLFSKLSKAVESWGRSQARSGTSG